MSGIYAVYPVTGGGGVTSIDGITGAITLVAGSGITITPSGQNITITATNAGAVTTIGPIDSEATPSSDGATISGNDLIMQSASATVPGLVNNSAQTFSGAKTFLSTITASNFSGSSSGTNTGDVTLGTADGLSLSGQILSLALATSSTPGAVPNIGGANGVAPLDASSKIPVAYLPSVVMEYEGAWNPNTNTPALADGTGTNGNVYYVTAQRAAAVSGNTDPSMVNFQIGDLVIYSSSVGKWQLVTPAAGVQSVNGAQGAVTVNAINQLTGDGTAGPASGSASAALTLATVNSNVGSFTNANITVNAKGLITAASSGSGGTGTVTSVSVVSANGLAGTVATPTTTPAITLSTTVTGLLSGDGTTISAATTTGTGSVVLATSPTLVTPALGTPSSGTATNLTGLPLTTGVTGILPLANGGTNASLTAANGAIPYSTATAIALLAPGTSGQVLTSGGAGAPTWNNALTNPMTTLGDIIYENAAPIPARLAGNTTSTLNVLTQTGTGSASAAPAWSTLAGAFGTQTANTVYAGPTSGAATTPTFRAIVSADLTSVTIPTVQTFTSSGTYTPSAGALYIKVTVAGAGGNGGAGGSGTVAGSGGGGGGGTAIGYMAISAITSTVTVTVPSSGSTTSFGAYATATTGTVGGVASGISNPGAGGTGGVGGGTKTYVTFNGADGQSGSIGVSGVADGTGGVGGSSFMGGGGYGGNSGGNAGIAGLAYGGGGGGGAGGGSGGGAGAKGIVIVEEFYQ